MNDLSVIYVNRDAEKIFNVLKTDTLYRDYLNISDEKIGIIVSVIERVMSKELYNDGRNMTFKEKLLYPYKACDEPLPDIKKTHELAESGLLCRLTDSLLSDKNYMGYLNKRGITKELVVKHKLGSTKSLDFETRKILGASIHPSMWKRYGTNIVDGILYPVESEKGFIGSVIRVLSQENMKFSLSAPNVFVSGIYQKLDSTNSNYTVVEGFFDKIALESIGITNVLTGFSASLNPVQISIILNRCVRNDKGLVLAFDSDRAGLREQLILGDICKYFGIPVTYTLLSDNAKDSAEFVHQKKHNKAEFYSGCISSENTILDIYIKEKIEAESTPDIQFEDYLNKRVKIKTDWL